MIIRDPDQVLIDALVHARPLRRRELFGELFERHRGRLARLCLRRTGNEADGADALQDTFVAAISKIGQFRGEARLSTWLYQVALARCREVKRKRMRRALPTSLALSDPRGGAQAIPDELLIPPHEGALAEERRERIRTAVIALPELLRSTVELRYFLGLPYEEIARLLDVPVGTVKSRLHRAHRALARRLVEYQLSA